MHGREEASPSILETGEALVSTTDGPTTEARSMAIQGTGPTTIQDSTTTPIQASSITGMAGTTTIHRVDTTLHTSGTTDLLIAQDRLGRL
jgi:hypothetical protein